jgi:hypothetical protein
VPCVRRWLGYGGDIKQTIVLASIKTLTPDEVVTL